MIISEEIYVSWNAKTKSHYVSAGYVFTKIGDKFLVRVDDLTPGCNEKIAVKCDYCGAIFDIAYYRYIDSQKEAIKKDCCGKCKKLKIRDTLYEKYGVFVPSDVDGAKQRAKQTNLRIYGVENPFASEAIKQKIKSTNLERYGYTCANRNSDVQEKRKATCMKRYGADSHMKTSRYRERFSGESSPRWDPNKRDIDRERDRSCSEYREWRYQVFKRDGYRCKCCGGKGDRKHGIEAHHISNYGSDVDSRFIVSNGITLCYCCHKTFHHLFGKTNNNRNQLEEFLNQGKKVC